MFKGVALRAVLLLLSAVGFTACNPNLGGQADSSGGTTSSLSPLTSAAPFTTCKNGDPKHICLGIKYVVYQDTNGESLISAKDAQANIDTVNRVWQQCNIGFEVDKFVSANPADFGLKLNTGTYDELTSIRNAFYEDRYLLIASTGSWNRKQSLGNTGANAWTSLPGGGPYGTVLEHAVDTNANIVAHELGHYLNLDHVTDIDALMNPIIYSYSTNMYRYQCQTARSAALYFWGKAIR